MLPSNVTLPCVSCCVNKQLVKVRGEKTLSKSYIESLIFYQDMVSSLWSGIFSPLLACITAIHLPHL